MEHTSAQFATADGLLLLRQAWRPEGEPAAVLAVVHGYGEHGGRYRGLAEEMAARGYAVHVYDLRGHGRSGGRRGHLGRFADYLDDTAVYLEAVRGEHRGQPLYLLGHSLGGLIATAYVEDRPADALAGLVLSSPFLRLGMPVPPLKLGAARLLSIVAPTVNVGNTVVAAALSHDQDVVRAYGTDPLNHHVATARWAAEAVAAQGAALSAASGIRLPFLLLYGDADAVADPQAARELFARVVSADKTMHCYEGYFHEIFNETGRAAVFADLAAWLEARAPAGGAD
ncbi:MAG: lysophospholipase [Actinobacteria bacterium]|nr:lysophospholipase [Actinomycetota bacterium]